LTDSCIGIADFQQVLLIRQVGNRWLNQTTKKNDQVIK